MRDRGRIGDKGHTRDGGLLKVYNKDLNNFYKIILLYLYSISMNNN